MPLEQFILSPAQIHELADHVRGSCMSIDEALMDPFNVKLPDIDNESLREFDALVGQCESCDWWFDASELDHDRLCPDCAC